MKKIKDMAINEYCAVKKHPKFNDTYPFATGDYRRDKVRCSKGFVNFNPRIKQGDYVTKIGNWLTRIFMPLELFKVIYVYDYSAVITIKSINSELEHKVNMGAVRLATPKEIKMWVK